MGQVINWSEVPDVVIFDGFDEAILGVGQRFTSGGHKNFLIYDYNKCVEIVAEQMEENPDSGSEHERAELAAEYLSYNVLDCYAGETTPAFMMQNELTADPPSGTNG